MSTVRVQKGVVVALLSLLACPGLSAAQTSAGAKDTKAGAKSSSPVDAIRKALDEKVTIDYASQSIQEAVNHLRQKSKINIVLDLQTLMQIGIGFEEQPTPIQLKVDNVKVKQALQKMLSQFHLTYVILGDMVMITTEEMAHHRQMSQRVTVDVKDVPLQGALKKLADETAANLVIDPRFVKDAERAVSLQLEDVSLETAVRLLTEIGGLKSVRVGNVLFVTSEDRAKKMREEQPQRDPRFGPPMLPFIGGMTVPGFPGGGANGVIPPRAVPDRPPEAVPPTRVDPPPPAQDLPVRQAPPPPKQ